MHKFKRTDSPKKKETENEQLHELGESTVKKVHKWKQEGFHLICRSCPSTHGIFIGPDRIMVGEKENGEPILKKR